MPAIPGEKNSQLKGLIEAHSRFEKAFFFLVFYLNLGFKYCFA
jgi:hypothetical protein